MKELAKGLMDGKQNMKVFQPRTKGVHGLFRMIGNVLLRIAKALGVRLRDLVAEV